MTQAEFFTKHYKQLYKSIKNLKPEEKQSLITQLYIEFNRKWDTLEILPEQEIIKIACRTVYNQYNWGNSAFNKFEKGLETEELTQEISNKVIQDSKSIEIQSESTSKIALDWLTDLQENYTQEQIGKLIDLELVKDILQPHEKVLYQMYFYDDLNPRQIAEKVKLNNWTTTMMIREMRIKLKQAVEQLNLNKEVNENK